METNFLWAKLYLPLPPRNVVHKANFAGIVHRRQSVPHILARIVDSQILCSLTSFSKACRDWMSWSWMCLSCSSQTCLPFCNRKTHGVLTKISMKLRIRTVPQRLASSRISNRLNPLAIFLISTTWEPGAGFHRGSWRIATAWRLRPLQKGDTLWR